MEVVRIGEPVAFFVALHPRGWTRLHLVCGIRARRERQNNPKTPERIDVPEIHSKYMDRAIHFSAGPRYTAAHVKK